MEEPGRLQSMGSVRVGPTERLHFHFSLSCIGERNGTPLQCSCLENPRDRGAWWAAVSGVAQSRTRLKRLGSSSSSDFKILQLFTVLNFKYIRFNCLIKDNGIGRRGLAAKSLQSCPTLCDPIDGSPPGSPVPEILQARTLEWVAISFSNA